MPASRVGKLTAELAALKKEEKTFRAAAMKAQREGKDPMEFFSLRDALRIIWRSGAIEGQLKTVDGSGNARALAMGVSDRKEIHDAPHLERGEIKKPGKRVPRGFPGVIELEDPPRVPENQSGRLELARWLTHPDHPLTARVMANRIWHHLFGAGIVRTVDNFGSNGERPSHPELLDHLTLKFVAGNWSVKTLIREIVLSRTYRQASTYEERSFKMDPENRLLWRATKRRLDAEAIRDAAGAPAIGQRHLATAERHLIAGDGDRLEQCPADHPLGLLVEIGEVVAAVAGAVLADGHRPVSSSAAPLALAFAASA